MKSKPELSCPKCGTRLTQNADGWIYCPEPTCGTVVHVPRANKHAESVELATLVVMLRELGVTHYKTPSLELVLGELPRPAAPVEPGEPDSDEELASASGFGIDHAALRKMRGAE